MMLVCDGPDHNPTKNMQQQPASFSSLVEVMNLDGEAPQIDIIWREALGSKKVGELFCQGIKVEMSELNLAFYTYVVTQSQAEGLVGLAQINQVDFLKIKQFALDYLQISEGADELHRQQYADYQAGDMAFVRDRKNEVNTALTARLGALGSRGLCSAPLAAEILASQMSNEPLPMDKETLAALNPNRLWVRKLLKGKAVK